MPKVSDQGAQNNPSGEAAGGFLASATSIFESGTKEIRDARQAVNDALGLGGGLPGPDGKRKEGDDVYRSSRLAHKTFGLDNEYFNDTTPYLGFQYFVRVNYNGELSEFVKQYFGDTNYSKTQQLVKSVTMPSIGVESEIFNEYNRKRISQTKLKFDPVDIVFHDVINGSTLKLWQMYYQYYFADGREKSASTRDAPVNPLEIKIEDFGYDIAFNGNDGDIRYLYKSIEIFQIHAGEFTKVTLYNPRIVDFKHANLAYSSNELVEISYTFDYEWAEYEFINTAEDDTSTDIENEEDIFEYLKQGYPLDYAEWTVDPNKKVAKGKKYPPGLLGDILEAKDTVQAGIDTVNEAKAFARDIAGKAQSISALGNQLQKDLLGVDEPPFPIPDVRPFTAAIDNIPTNFQDFRRVRKGGG
jgi:hypothetical protein